MQQCAFCLNEADLTGEHIWSDWMNRVLPPSGPFQVTSTKGTGEPICYRAHTLNMKLRVVCEKCNNGWMSELESYRAIPAMKDLILSDKGVLLTSQRLESIAIFAFKCAVIADHSSFLKPKFKNRELFFSADCRTAFRQSLAIPEGVQMWLAASKEDGRGTFRDTYRPSPPSVARGFELYELTYGVGYLIFQVVATRWLGDGSKGDLLRFGHGRYWNKFCLPLWPNDGCTVLWPPDKQLTPELARRFSERWKDTKIRYPND